MLDELMNDADDLLRAGNVAEAARAYSEIIISFPKDPDAFAGLGRCHFERGDMREASFVLRKAVALDRSSEHAVYNLGLALLERAKPVLARVCFAHCLDLDASSYQAHFNLAAALKQSGQIEKAVEHLRLATKLNPSYVVAWNNLGTGLRTLGDNNGAAKAFRRGLKQAPYDDDLVLNLGMCLTDLHQRKRAIRLLRPLLDRPEPAREAFQALASVLFDDAQYQEALKVAEDGGRLYNEDADFFNQIGMCLSKLFRDDFATRFYTRALAIDPTSPFVHNNLGISYRCLGALSEALVHGEEAVRLMPDQPSHRYNLARTLMDSGRIPEAIAQYRHAVSQDDTDGLTHLMLARALRKENRTNEAEAEYMRAIHCGPAAVRISAKRELSTHRVHDRPEDFHQRAE